MARAGHLSDGTLRALADRQLPLFEWLTCSAHLALCNRCRATLEASREAGRETAGLLALLEQPVDTEAAWRRVTERRPGARPAVPRQSAAGNAWLAWAVAGLLAVVAGTLAADRIGGAPSLAASGNGHRDICCWDLDGGGPSDDGVMTISSAGEMLDCVVLYDDIDRSRSFTDGDAIRYISRPESCAALRALAPRSAHPGRLAMLVSGE